jgi:hypothetical protein
MQLPSRAAQRIEQQLPFQRLLQISTFLKHVSFGNCALAGRIAFEHLIRPLRHRLTSVELTCTVSHKNVCRGARKGVSCLPKPLRQKHGESKEVAYALPIMPVEQSRRVSFRNQYPLPRSHKLDQTYRLGISENIGVLRLRSLSFYNPKRRINEACTDAPGRSRVTA